jgi:hypothetical protein
MKLFQTTVRGVGPYCVEFDDGEIVTTRTAERQALIGAAEDMLAALKYFVNRESGDLPAYMNPAIRKATAAIAKAEGRS